MTRRRGSTARRGIAVIGFALAAAAAAPLPDRLSPEQLARLQIIALQQGSTIPMPAALVDVLHLTPAQVSPSVRQVSFQEDDGVKHGFARLNDGSGYFLFRRSQEAGVSAYHVDRSFHLVAAAHNFTNERYMALPDAAAQAQLADEARAWSRVLTPKGAPPAAAPVAPAAPQSTP